MIERGKESMARPLHKNLTVQVLTAVLVGAVIGALWPRCGEALRPLSDGFLRLVKMVVAPIIFLTVVVGLSSMGDLKKVGRVGLKSLVYFEIVTTIALGIGLVVANVLRPGAGIDTSGASAAEVAQYAADAKKHTATEFLLNIIPDNIIGAFAKGELLQILFFSVLFGIAIASLRGQSTRLMAELEHLTEVMFRVVGLIMKVAPLGALGAIAFTVGKFGVHSLGHLIALMGCVYLTMAIFIFGVLGIIARVFGFSLWRYLVFIREEIVLVLGTSSSETALPRMIEKLEMLGCSRSVVGLVIPTGYSLNLDGTNIYLSMAVLFIAQAFGVHLSIFQQLSILGILVLTSKGAAAVTGAGFVTLAATLSATHVLPVEGLALLLGVDRFMSEARAITNLIGNGVATIVVAKLEGEFSQTRYEAAIRGASLDSKIAGLPVEVEADLAREEPIP